MRARPLPLLLALVLSLAASRGAAQVGTTTDIITGTVTGPDSQPLPGAVVQATSPVVHAHARARPVVLLVLRGDARILGALHGRRPQRARVGDERLRAASRVPRHRHLSRHGGA